MVISRKILWRRAAKTASMLRLVPFLRMAALNGSVASGNDNIKSDIDFLIIVKSGRLYTARAFAILLISLTSWRRRDRDPNPAGKICLNCFLSDTHPDISPKNKKSRQKVAFSNKFLITLVDIGGVEENFFKINSWMNKFTSSSGKYSKELKKTLVPSGAHKPFRLFEPILSGRFGDFVEKILMNYQVQRIISGKRKGDETVASKSEIRLHPIKTLN